MTPEIDRRTLIGGIAAATGAGLAPAAAQSPAKGAAMPLDIRPLPFDAKSISGLSEKIILSHQENNYSGAVRRYNAITDQLAASDFASAPNFALNGLKREQLIALNSAILHEVYFASLGAGGAPEGALASAMARDFGSVERWQAEFAAMGKALGGGSGWVLLSYSPRLARLVNLWAADHAHTGADAVPILALDMYEHAYHMDYGAKAAAYVDAFMATINWPGVAARYAAAVRS